MRGLKKELAWLGSNLAAGGLGAFLAAFGCVILWISGGSGWYALKAMRDPLPPLAVLFVLSLLSGGFCGLAAALAVRCAQARGKPEKDKSPVGHIAAAYLFGLGWYAVFFCTRLTLFGAVLLAAALPALAAAGIRLWKRCYPAAVWMALIPAALIDLVLLTVTLLAA